MIEHCNRLFKTSDMTPSTQQEGGYTTVEKRRGRSKGAAKKDTEDSEEAVEVIPDSQSTAVKRTRTTAERKPTQKVIEATQDNDIQALYDMIVWLKEAMKWQSKVIESQKKEITALCELPQAIEKLQKEIADLKTTQVKLYDEARRAFSEQTDILHIENTKIQNAVERTQPSYAAITSIPPTNSLDILPMSPPISRPPSPASTDTIICTINTIGVREQDRGKATPGSLRDAIEKELSTEGNKFRCVAVYMGGNAGWVKIRARNEEELQRIKDAAQKIVPEGARVLRDQLYPIKVDNIKRIAILNNDGTLQAGIAEKLGAENNVNIAKVTWLSKKDNFKAYGSMAVFFSKSGDRDQYLRNQYFDAGGESGSTALFIRREVQGPCYKCQKHGHKAFQCKGEQTCAKCAGIGHHHSACRATIPKCANCQGPHEVFSRNCTGKAL